MVSLLLSLAVVGFLVYLIVTYIPMPAPFKTGIIVIAVVCIVLYVLQLFGLDLPLPRHR